MISDLSNSLTLRTGCRWVQVQAWPWVSEAPGYMRRKLQQGAVSLENMGK